MTPSVFETSPGVLPISFIFSPFVWFIEKVFRLRLRFPYAFLKYYHSVFVLGLTPGEQVKVLGEEIYSEVKHLL